jgi:hypothetical protein
MHCIASKALHIDVMVIENVSVKSIVMPRFLVLFTFQIRLENIQQSGILTKVIDK